MVYFYDFGITRLGIAEERGFITRVFFGCEMSGDYEMNETPEIKKAAEEFYEYFRGGRRSFSIRYYLSVPDFSYKVLTGLLNIPYGETRTYGEAAAAAGRPNAARAIGNICNKNPLPIIIPCHRVLGKNGALTGYAGGTELKRQLLELESNV